MPTGDASKPHDPSQPEGAERALGDPADFGGASGVFAPVRAELNFPADESVMLAFWKEHRIFHKTLRAETRATGPSKGTFVFYEGPPTANGMPHNGHVLTRAV